MSLRFNIYCYSHTIYNRFLFLLLLLTAFSSVLNAQEGDSPTLNRSDDLQWVGETKTDGVYSLTQEYAAPVPVLGQPLTVRITGSGNGPFTLIHGFADSPFWTVHTIDDEAIIGNDKEESTITRTITLDVYSNIPGTMYLPQSKLLYRSMNENSSLTLDPLPVQFNTLWNPEKGTGELREIALEEDSVSLWILIASLSAGLVILAALCFFFFFYFRHKNRITPQTISDRYLQELESISQYDYQKLLMLLKSWHCNRYSLSQSASLEEILGNIDDNLYRYSMEEIKTLKAHFQSGRQFLYKGTQIPKKTATQLYQFLFTLISSDSSGHNNREDKE